MAWIITTGHSGRIAVDQCRVSGACRVGSPTGADPSRPVPAGAGDPSGATMAAPRRIGILTGGGDVPGLNSVIKSVVYRATDLGYEVLGIRPRWGGPTHQPRGGAPDPHA